jgi:ferrous iron transport protein B
MNPKSEDERVTIDVLNGRIEGIARPDAIILVLDSTNLSRHLVLAARVIALGVPTLVVLNMADELAKQGGHVDVLELARQLGTSVALVSAATGEGIQGIGNFLSSAAKLPEPIELPVLHDTRGCREWAVRVGSNANYQPSRHSRVDAPPRQHLSASHLGPGDFGVVVIGVFQTIFAVGQPLSNLFQRMLDVTGTRLAALLPEGSGARC